MAEQPTANTERVTDELKPIIKTTNGKLFIAALVILPFWAIGIFWLAGEVLSPEDAQIIKAPIAAILGVAGSTGIVGMAVRSLMTSNGKIAAQVAQATQSTPPPMPLWDEEKQQIVPGYFPPPQHQPQNYPDRTQFAVEVLPLNPDAYLSTRREESADDSEARAIQAEAVREQEARNG